MKGRLWNTLRVVFILSKRSSWLLALPIKQNNHQYETTVVTSLPRHHILLLCLRRCIHLFLISLIHLSVTWPVLFWSGHMKFSSFVQIVIDKQLILFPVNLSWSWKFIKPRCNGGRRSKYIRCYWLGRLDTLIKTMLCYVVLLPSCNVARSEILAWNSFIVRCHVTSK